MSSYNNFPNEWNNKRKSSQHWLKKKGQKFIFLGEGNYVPLLTLQKFNQLIAQLNFNRSKKPL